MEDLSLILNDTLEGGGFRDTPMPLLSTHATRSGRDWAAWRHLKGFDLCTVHCIGMDCHGFKQTALAMRGLGCLIMVT